MAQTQQGLCELYFLTSWKPNRIFVAGDKDSKDENIQPHILNLEISGQLKLALSVNEA